MVRFWLQRFRSRNLDLHNKPRGRLETKMDNEELSTAQLTVGIAMSDKTVIYLKQIGKIKKD